MPLTITNPEASDCCVGDTIHFTYGDPVYGVADYAGTVAKVLPSGPLVDITTKAGQPWSLRYSLDFRVRLVSNVRIERPLPASVLLGDILPGDRIRAHDWKYDNLVEFTVATVADGEAREAEHADGSGGELYLNDEDAKHSSIVLLSRPEPAPEQPVDELATRLSSAYDCPKSIRLALGRALDDLGFEVVCA